MEFPRLAVVSAAPVVVGAAQPVVGRAQIVVCRAQPVGCAGQLFARAAQPVASVRLPVVAAARPFVAFRQPFAPAPQWIVGTEQRVGEDVRLFVSHALLVIFGVPGEIQGRALAPAQRGHEPANASCGAPAVGFLHAPPRNFSKEEGRLLRAHSNKNRCKCASGGLGGYPRANSLSVG